MNYLLIHSNNSGLVDYPNLFPNQVVFDQSLNGYEEVDFYLQKFVEFNAESIKKSSAIFIKYCLTSNYSELIGLRLGHYIRLSNELGKCRCQPIIFLGSETPVEILKLSSLGSILATPGTYYVREDVGQIKKVIERIQNDTLPSLLNFQEYISRVYIPAPANYESHHEIANEWSILRWAKVIGINNNDPRLSKAKQNIEGLLYYKYLIAEYPNDAILDKKKALISTPGKIMFIDDEWDKGWASIFEELFKLSPVLTGQFYPAKIVFRDLQQAEIVSKCVEQLNTINPDLVILDLRLCNSDFQVDKQPTEFTGYKVLEAIKKFNPGVQVIIFSATNKIWNLLELQQAGADNFILKESPEVRINKDFLTESIYKFVKAVTEILKKSFLKDLLRKCFSIRRSLSQQYEEENPKYNKFIENLKVQLEVAISAILSINLKRPVTIDIAFLAFYNFLELFKGYYLKFDNRDYRYYLGYEEVSLKRFKFGKGKLVTDEEFVENGRFDSPSWFVTLAGLFVDYFKLSNTPFKEIKTIRDLADRRNDYIHSSKSFFKREELEQIVDIAFIVCSRLRE